MLTPTVLLCDSIPVVSQKYPPPPPPPPPSRISPPDILSAKSCWGIFIPRISPPPPPPPLEEDLSCSRITEIIFILATRLSTVKVSTANANRPHQRWTRQVLRGSALLSRPSTLKLVSLPLASGASLRLAFGYALCLASPPPPLPIMLYRKGGRIRERNCRIPRISPPYVLY